MTREARIKRRLRKHLASLGFTKDAAGQLCPPESSKDCFRSLHLAQRNEKLERDKAFIQSKWPKFIDYFADGDDVVPNRIAPRLEIISGGTWQSDLFRLASLTWSVPVSQGYGRRMRFLVWDDHNGKLIGLLGLGDPVFNLRVRDEWVGWSVEQRRKRLVNVLDAFVLGALPPYNMLLGGKLVASLIRTREVRDEFTARYARTKGIISKKRKHAELCLVTTTSALGRSSLYNRLALDGYRIFTPIGYTAGWGHFHIPEALFKEIREYLEAQGDEYADNHRFGDGPNWKLRAIRKALTLVGVDDGLLKHGIEREVFACPLAQDAKQVLQGTRKFANYRGLPRVREVTELALRRWIVPRAERRPEFALWRAVQLQDLLVPQDGSAVEVKAASGGSAMGALGGR